MKAAAFEYVRPASLDEACAIMAGDEDARIVSGGQTLIPMMAMRLARPARLVDVMRLEGLSGISERDGGVHIGATTLQVDVERSETIARNVPLLAAAMPWVGHAPTRSRGTVGGSVANADPAAEIGLVLVTLGGKIHLRNGSETHTFDSDAFFLGPMTTEAPSTSCLTGVELPVWRAGRIGVGIDEIASRRSDFALASAAAQVALDDGGTCSACAVGVGGATPVPTKLTAVGEALVGSRLDDKTIEDAVRAAAAELEIMTDGHASPQYRRRAAIALAVGALKTARDNAMKVAA